jgi:hypothetical protein
MQKTVGTRLGVLGLLLGILLSSLLSCAGLALAPVPPSPAPEDYGIAYSLIRRSSPRPLRIHLAVADLGKGRLRLSAPVPHPAARPGAWDARLEDPLRESERIGSLVLVNASAFSVLGFGPGRRPLEYLPGMRVDIAGLAIHEGRPYSQSREGFAALLADAEGRISAGYGLAPEGCAEAAAGFRMLVVDGADRTTPGGSLAARTAVGQDDRGRLLFVVVEGGRKGPSEGVSLSELAAFMLEQGALWALNTDGGGSSALVLRRGGREELVSEGGKRFLGLRLPPRPVPNFLAILPRGP